MKKLLVIIAVIISYAAQGQAGYTTINSRYNWLGGVFRALHIPAFATTPSLSTGQYTGSGAVGLDSVTGRFYVYVQGSWRRQLNITDTVSLLATQYYVDQAVAGVGTPTLAQVLTAGNVGTNHLFINKSDGSIQAYWNSGNASIGINSGTGSGRLRLTNVGGFPGTVESDSLTGSRTYQLPDQDGTLALLSDITSGISFGADNQIPFTNSSTDDFDYSSAFTFDNATLNVDGAAIFNASGANVDFNVEGDTDPNTFFVDASADRVGIGDNTPAAKLSVVTSSGNYIFTAEAESSSTPGRFYVSTGNAGAATVSSENGDQSSDWIASAGVSVSNSRPNWHVGRTGGDPSPFEIRSYHPSGAFFEQRIYIVPQGEMVINEGSLDRDFRIETDGDANALFVDGGTNEAHIGGTSDLGAGKFQVHGKVQTTGGILKRTGTVASSGTPTINTDDVDFYSITALAVPITSFTTNLSGTPTENQTLWIAITDDGTPRALAWGASFEASTTSLPTTTVTSTRLDVGFVWNSVTSKWRCVAVQ